MIYFSGQNRSIPRDTCTPRPVTPETAICLEPATLLHLACDARAGGGEQGPSAVAGPVIGVVGDLRHAQDEGRDRAAYRPCRHPHQTAPSPSPSATKLVRRPGRTHQLFSLLQVKGLCAEPAGRWWLVLRSMTQPWDRFERTTKVWVRAHRSARLGRVACSKMRIFWARLQVALLQVMGLCAGPLRCRWLALRSTTRP